MSQGRRRLAMVTMPEDRKLRYTPVFDGGTWSASSCIRRGSKNKEEADLRLEGLMAMLVMTTFS